MSVATVRSLRTAARVTVSLDQPVGEDTLHLGDLVADDRSVDPSEDAISCEIDTRCQRCCGCSPAATGRCLCGASA